MASRHVPAPMSRVPQKSIALAPADASAPSICSADDGKSNPACLAGSCTSVMEGLGSIPSELNANQPYVAMVKQLTAASRTIPRENGPATTIKSISA
jgi:hypothetical protein